MDENELVKQLTGAALRIGMLHSGILVIGQKVDGGLMRCMQIEVQHAEPEQADTAEKPRVLILLHPYLIPPYLKHSVQTSSIEVRDGAIVGDYEIPSQILRDTYVSRIFGETKKPEKEKTQ